MVYGLAGHDRRREIENGDAEGIAQLRIGRAFTAGIRMRRFPVLLMLGQILERMVNGVRSTGLLREQQDKDEKKPDGQTITHSCFDIHVGTIILILSDPMDNPNANKLSPREPIMRRLS